MWTSSRSVASWLDSSIRTMNSSSRASSTSSTRFSSSSFSTTTPVAPASPSRYSTCRGEELVYTVDTTPPAARIPKSAWAHSIRVWAKMPTRSPSLTPSSRKPAASRLTMACISS